jgi:hypothetical protein
MYHVGLAARLVFFIVAVSFSCWYGKNAIEALEVSEKDKDRIAKSPALRKHQWWLNFLGSFVGWCLAYIVLQHVYPGYRFEPVDGILAFLAFIGMTGHLPFVVKHVWKWNFPWGKKTEGPE